MANRGTLDVLVRAARTRAGLTQAELADRAGVTRQAVSAIEAGKTAPTMPVALRMARALGARVDEIFRLVDELPRVVVDLVGDPGQEPDAPLRVQVAEIDGRLIGRALAGEAGALLRLPRASGIVRSRPTPGQPATVDLLSDPGRLQRTVVAIGCDPAMGLLADHLAIHYPTMELVYHGGSSLAALEAVARGEAHLAGTHLLDPAAGEYNAALARRMLGDDVCLVTFAVWEQGLIVASGNPRGIYNVADLARPGLRLANREVGSGARALLERELHRLGLADSQVPGYDSVVRGHLAAAGVVAAGLADAAVGVRAAAHALGLGFVPLARERYDLAIPGRFMEQPPIQALLETLQSPLFRLEVEALGGYDVSVMGEMVGPTT